MRICSFLPSATEMVYALGMGHHLYAVSHECDYPGRLESCHGWCTAYLKTATTPAARHTVSSRNGLRRVRASMR